MSPSRTRRPVQDGVVDVRATPSLDPAVAEIDLPEIETARPSVQAAISPLLDLLSSRALPVPRAPEVELAPPAPRADAPGWAREVDHPVVDAVANAVDGARDERRTEREARRDERLEAAADSGRAVEGRVDRQQVLARRAERDEEGAEEGGAEGGATETAGSGVTGAAGGPPAAEPADGPSDGANPLPVAPVDEMAEEPVADEVVQEPVAAAGPPPAPAAPPTPPAGPPPPVPAGPPGPPGAQIVTAPPPAPAHDGPGPVAEARAARAEAPPEPALEPPVDGRRRRHGPPGSGEEESDPLARIVGGRLGPAMGAMAGGLGGLLGRVADRVVDAIQDRLGGEAEAEQEGESESGEALAEAEAESPVPTADPAEVEDAAPPAPPPDAEAEADAPPAAPEPTTGDVVEGDGGVDETPPLELPAEVPAPAPGHEPVPVVDVEPPAEDGTGGAAGDIGVDGAVDAIDAVVDEVESGALDVTAGIDEVTGTAGAATADVDAAAADGAAALDADVAAGTEHLGAQASAGQAAADQTADQQIAQAQSGGETAAASANAAANSARQQAQDQAANTAARRQVTKESLAQQVQTELDAQLEELRAGQETQLQELDTAFAQQTAALEQESAAKQAELEQHLAQELTSLDEHRAAEEARLVGERDAQITRLDATLQTETTNVNTTAEAQKTATRAAADQEIASIRSTAEASAGAAIADANAQAASLPEDSQANSSQIIAAGQSRAAEIRAQAEANVAAAEQRAQGAIDTLEADRATTVASLTAEHDAGVAAATQQCETWRSAMDSDLHLHHMALQREQAAAFEELEAARQTAVEDLRQEQEAKREQIATELETKVAELEERKADMLLEVEEASTQDLDELQQEVDALVAEVEADVDQTLATVEQEVDTAIAETEALRQQQLESVVQACEVAKARISTAVQAQKDAWTGTVEYAREQIIGAADEAVASMGAISSASQSLAVEEGTQALLDLATLGEATRTALGEDTQGSILDAEIGALTHGIEYDRIEVSADGTTRIVRDNVNGTQQAWSVGQVELGSGHAQVQVTDAGVIDPRQPGAETQTITAGVTYGDGQYGVNTGYKVTSGEGADREQVHIDASASFGGGNVSGNVGWGWEVGEGADATGHEEERSGSVGADGVTVGSGSYDTEGGYRSDGSGYEYHVGPDGIEVGGNIYRNGFGVGGSVGVGPDGGSVGLNGGYRALRGGGEFEWTDDGYGISGNIGVAPAGGRWGASLGGSYSVTTDEEFTQYVGDDATGRYGFAHEVTGTDLVSYGLRDEESWSVNASANVRAVSLGFAYGEQHGSGVQYMQDADNIDLTDEIAPLLAIRDDPEWARNHWIALHPEEFADKVADESSDRVEGVNGPQDLAFGETGSNGEMALNDDVLARGSAWSFDNFAGQQGEGTIGLYGLGLTLGGSNHEYQELTIARTSEGEDNVLVEFTTMDQEGMNARLGLADLLTIGGSETNTNTRTVRFQLDPTNPQDVEALQRLTSTGLLPGAETAMEQEDRERFDELYAQVTTPGISATELADAQEEIASLSNDANETFVNDDDFQLGEEYIHRTEEFTSQHAGDLSLAGFELASGGWQESWYSADYLEGDDQQREIGYEYARDESHFLLWKTGDSENSFVALNPEEAGDISMIGGSEWRLEREQAQLFIDLGLAGSDDWRMQMYADDELDNFTGIGRASMALDDEMMADTLAFFQDQDLSSMWADVGERMREDNEYWFEYLTGQSSDGYTSEYEILSMQMGGVDFVDHSDPEALLAMDPVQVLQEEAKREAWRQNEEQILDWWNGQAYDDEHHYDSVDDLMDALATQGDDAVPPEIRTATISGSWQDVVNGMATESYGDQMESSVNTITHVETPEQFAAMNPAQQDAWLHIYSTMSDNNPWYALDMIAGAVDAETDEEAAGEMQDRLVRRLFREAELGTDDSDTATMQYISFIGELQAEGGAWADLAETLKTGVYVQVVDEGVIDKAKEAGEGGALTPGEDGPVLETGSDYVGGLDTEVEHLLDNEGDEDKGDADELMDRVEGLRLAAGSSGADVMVQWVDHASTAAGYSSVDDFVAELATQIAPNDEYADKLIDAFYGTPYYEDVRQHLGRS